MTIDWQVESPNKVFFSRILFYTTQPAHLITAFSVLYIAYLCFPSKGQSPISPLWTLIYLISFSTHFGAQIWMTFVSGLALYFNLPRHVFGNVQKVLFPKYFLLNSILSLVTLAIFLRSKNHDLFVAENAVQVINLFKTTWCVEIPNNKWNILSCNWNIWPCTLRYGFICYLALFHGLSQILLGGNKFLGLPNTFSPFLILSERTV